MSDVCSNELIEADDDEEEEVKLGTLSESNVTILSVAVNVSVKLDSADVYGEV